MQRELSVVFPLYREENRIQILMGRQAIGKKLAGFRNGYGGKCEFLEAEDRTETTLECASRELEEELGLYKNYQILVDPSEFEFVGHILMSDRKVDFFILKLKVKIFPPEDNQEFTDTKWFNLNLSTKKINEIFVEEMLSGDEKIIAGLKKFLLTGEKFVIDKGEDKILESQVKNVFTV